MLMQILIVCPLQNSVVLDDENPWKWLWMEIRFHVFFSVIYFMKAIVIIGIIMNTPLLQIIEI